jgi:hypothetical protein
MHKRIAIIVFFLCIQTVCAEELSLVYEGADLIDVERRIVEHHHIALSKNKKIDGRWLFENEKKISGVLYKRLYEITTDDNYQDVANSFKQHFDTLKQHIQFFCEGRSCGSSNKWANGVFHESRLYGSDNKQFYWVLFDGHTYSVAYLIERGSKRLYFYQETLEPLNIQNISSLFNDKDCPNNAQLALIKNTLIDKNGIYFLLYSLPGTNTAQLSHAKAEQCVDLIKSLISNVSITPLGLGEYMRHNHARIFDSYVELVKFIE